MAEGTKYNGSLTREAEIALRETGIPKANIAIISSNIVTTLDIISEYYGGNAHWEKVGFNTWVWYNFQGDPIYKTDDPNQMIIDICTKLKLTMETVDYSAVAAV